MSTIHRYDDGCFSTDRSAQSGYSIILDGHWFGYEWSRVGGGSPGARTTCLTYGMTEPEARAWLAEVAG
jgi:hypothetical protein